MESFLNDSGKITRRHFVKISSITAVGFTSLGLPDQNLNEVSIIVNPNDNVARTNPSLWALDELQKSLVSKGIMVNSYENLQMAKPDKLIQR